MTLERQLDMRFAVESGTVREHLDSRKGRSEAFFGEKLSRERIPDPAVQFAPRRHADHGSTTVNSGKQTNQGLIGSQWFPGSGPGSEDIRELRFRPECRDRISQEGHAS